MKNRLPGLSIVGLAAPYEIKSTVLGLGSDDQFEEIFCRGAFRKFLEKRGRCTLLVGHGWDHPDDAWPFSDTADRTLELFERDDGLYFRALIADDDRGRRVWERCRSGELAHASVGFEPLLDTWDEECRTRYITEAGLVELSLCGNLAAYPQTHSRATTFAAAVLGMDHTDRDLPEVEAAERNLRWICGRRDYSRQSPFHANALRDRHTLEQAARRRGPEFVERLRPLLAAVE